MEKKSQNNLWKLMVGALGIVFGDIGTSPLYTLKECFSPHLGLELNEANVLGILSLIFWALFLVVIVKYIVFIMKADNRGEGGIMSLCSLIMSKISEGKTLLVVTAVGLIGTALLLADGMITPAMTVLGAVEGLEIATPFFKPIIIPITVGIIIALFVFQKHGTEKIGKIFGPIMIGWFVVIALLGIRYIFKAPQVLHSLNPYYAANFFLRNGIMSIFILSAIVLAITGAEALYADMGHFGKEPIKLAFYFLVLPSLTLNYFGQGAAIILHGAKAIENPFYFISPSWFIYPLIILATLAAIIASQALISGSFSIIQQSMQLGYTPKMKVIHTSEETQGQIYIPFVNYSLMIACILLVVTFKSSGNLAAAYGMSVIGTMLCTTILYYVLINKIWKWKKIKVILVLVSFLFVDLSFLSANISKLVSGGWFPLLIALFIYLIMLTWKDGNEAIYEFIQKENIPLENIISSLSGDSTETKRTLGTAIFMIGRKNNLNVLLHHLKHNKLLHERVFLMTVKFERVPFIDIQERMTLESYGANVYGINVRYGYMETPNINEIVALCFDKGHLIKLSQVSFYLGRISIGVSKKGNMALWRKKLFVFLHRNSESAVEYFKLIPGTVIELGRKVII